MVELLEDTSCATPHPCFSNPKSARRDKQGTGQHLLGMRNAARGPSGGGTLSSAGVAMGQCLEHRRAASLLSHSGWRVRAAERTCLRYSKAPAML